MGASSVTMKELREGLGSSDYYLISSLGITGSIKTEWQYLPAAFYGMGLYGHTTETAGANLNPFLQHSNIDLAMGITLTTTLENARGQEVPPLL